MPEKDATDKSATRTAIATPRRTLHHSLFPESDTESSIESSSPTTTHSRHADDVDMLTPRSRVRRLLGDVEQQKQQDRSNEPADDDAGSASDTSSTDHEVAAPRKKSGLAAMLRKRSTATTENSHSTSREPAPTAPSYQSIRRKMLMQLAKGRTPPELSKNNSSVVEGDATGTTAETADSDSDKENRGPLLERSTTRPRRSTAIGPFQIDSIFSDDRGDGNGNNDEDDEGALTATPTKKVGPLSRNSEEMSDSDNDHNSTPTRRRLDMDGLSSDDDDEDDVADNGGGGVGSLRDLLHDKTFMDNIRSKRADRLAIEAKKRAAEEKRKAQEIERIRLEQELERERLLESQLDMRRKPRKASKKALEEMNKETARIQRNRQLALQPVIVNKISKESLFAKFNFNPSSFLAARAQSQPNSSSSQPAGSDPASTPPSSPLQDPHGDKKANESVTATEPEHILKQQVVTDLDGDSDLDSPSDVGNKDAVQNLINSVQEKKIAANDRQKRPDLTTPVKENLTVLRAGLPEETLNMIKAAKAKSAGLLDRAIVHHLSDKESDSDLEILPPGQASAKKKSHKKKVTLENVRILAGKNVPLWRRLTAYKSPSKQLRKKGHHMTDRELEEMLQARIREQSRKEMEEKQAAIAAKGGKILSAEEKKKEDEIIEDLLERERRNAEETRKREKHERRRNGVVDDDDNFVDDEDENEDEDDDDDENEDEYDEEDIAELLSEESEDNQDNDSDSVEHADDLVEREPDNDEPGLTQFFEPTQKDCSLDNIKGDHELLQVKTPPLLQLPPQNPDSSPIFPPSSQFDTGQSIPRELQHSNAANDDDLSAAKPTKSSARYSSPELNRHRTGVDSEPTGPVTSFSNMLKAHGKRDKLGRRLQKSRVMKEMFDEHAEESDDEWKGVGGASDPEDESDDDEYDSELEAMVNDNVDENADRNRTAALFAADELNRDEKLVNDMIRGVHGGFRKRRQGDLYDLSDSDDESAYAERRRQRRDAKRRKHLLKDEKMSSLAENPKAQAFFKTIEEDERRLAEPRYVDVDDLEAFLNA
ncbi:MRC1-like domain-containing protein [Lipomyces kononenkoae]|uniref:MRC1-like domain-containing protein n=1 Tax=Lipomyces kononenkoae TaxID=34357 RepID=A0ACC3SWL9_LIPKO